MLYSGELIGVLAAYDIDNEEKKNGNQSRKFTERDARLLSLFASAAAGAVYSTRLLESERLRRRDAETLQQAAPALTSSLDAEKILDSLLDGLAKVIPFDSSSVFISEGKFIRVVAEKGPRASGSLLGRSFAFEGSMENYLFELRSPL